MQARLPHVANIAAGGGIFDADAHDKDSLRIGGVLVRESLGTDLLERVASVTSLESSGTVLFKVALDQVMFMNASTIRNLSNRLGRLALNKAPGEDVSTLTLEVSEIATELEGSGNAPTDFFAMLLQDSQNAILKFPRERSKQFSTR